MIKIEQININADNLNREPDCERLEIIATRNLSLFPGVIVHFELGRKPAQDLAMRARHAAFPIGIVCQTDPNEDEPSLTKGLYRYGVFADVLDVRNDAGSQPVAIVRARGRFRILGRAKPDENGIRPDWALRVKPLNDIEPADKDKYVLTVQVIRQLAEEALGKSGDPQGILPVLHSTDDNAMAVNMLATNLPIPIPEKMNMLSKSNIQQRAEVLSVQLGLFLDRVSVTDEIMQRARRTMDENQRNAFLQSQMDAIRSSLYGDQSEEVDELLQRAEKSGMPKKALETFRKEADKLRRYNPSSPDYSVSYTYLETLLELPWENRTSASGNISLARCVMEREHSGLEKVKQRIMEQLALLFHNPEHHGTILCLVGPPGVGKTSIGHSVALALNRKYQRVSLGGLHDESEIRGHRRTYIGAMPGRIIDAVRRSGVKNPVILLDEVDKIGQDYKGDPAAALLEVLDPEQNCRFHDNYIDVDFDLSEVLFIATANNLGTIPRPLLDRMEIIQLSGYLAEEKIDIARNHLLPRALTMHKITSDDLEITDDALVNIITRYTCESGVRELEKQIAALARKCVLAKLESKSFPHPVESSDLRQLLGLPPHMPEQLEKEALPGVVTGLAWTETGGEILMAEASLAPAKDGALTLTGNLGNVIKESVTLAYQWIKANAEAAGVDRSILSANAVHVHFPEGAIPKDGPSAGITVTTAIISALRHQPVSPKLAMTGEITLRGRVLPVGGIREKILAAKRAGVEDIVLSDRNRPDIEDLAEEYRKGLSFHYVGTIDELLKVALP